MIRAHLTKLLMEKPVVGPHPADSRSAYAASRHCRVISVCRTREILYNQCNLLALEKYVACVLKL
jgi:hypothetical protein